MNRLIVFLAICQCFLVVKSQNKFKRLPIDSISGITIQKLVYYQDPIVIKKGVYQDTAYKSVWYKTDQIINEKNNAVETLNYYQKRLGKSLDQIVKSKSDTVVLNIKNKYFAEYPMDYKFGEIWFKFNSTSEQVVVILNTIKKKEFNNIRFKNPGKINAESIDSLGIMSSPKAYIFEDNILKYADQVYIFQKMEDAPNIWIDFTLKGFKDVLFRAPTYIRSIKKTGKRVFESIENTANGAVIKSTNENLP